MPRLTETPTYRYFLLELRKNRMVYLALLSGVLISIPIAVFYAYVYKIDIAEALWHLVDVLGTAGLALASVILGANAGAGLRAELNENAETVLPLSNTKRIVAAILAATFWSILLFVGLWVFILQNMTFIVFLVVLCFSSVLMYFGVAAFGFAYLSKNGIFGGIAGVVLGFLLFMPGLLPGTYMLSDRESYLYFAAVLLALYCGMAGAVVVMAKCIGRGGKAGLLSAGILTGCLAFAPVASFGFLGAATVIKIIRVPSFQECNSSDGVFVAYRGGGLKWVTHGKADTIFKTRVVELPKLLLDPYAGIIAGSYWDKDGSLWSVREKSFKEYEILHGRKDGRFETVGTVVSEYVPFFVAMENGLSLKYLNHDGTRSIALITPGRPFEWKTYQKDDVPWLPAGRNIVTFDADRKGLTCKNCGGKARHWVLPGKLVDRSVPDFLLNLNGQPVPAALIKLPDHTSAVALCMPNGKVKLESTGRAYKVNYWRDAGEPEDMIKGYVLTGADGIRLLTENGKFLPLISIDELFGGKSLVSTGARYVQYPKVLRTEKSVVWIYLRGAVVQYDFETRKILAYEDLTKYCTTDTFTITARDGFYLCDDKAGTLYFVDWNGKAAKVNL